MINKRVNENALARIKDGNIRVLLDEYLKEAKNFFGKDLLASYIHGSIVLDDFQKGISDIDFLTVLKTPVNLHHCINLERIHAVISLKNKYGDLLEGEYVFVDDITAEGISGQTIRHGEGKTEFLNRREADEMIILFYIREKGVTLYGPSPKDIIPKAKPQSLNRFLFQCIKEMLPEVKSRYINQERDKENHYLSSDILNICRFWYIAMENRTISKTRAGLWAVQCLNDNHQKTVRSALSFRYNTSNQEDMKNMISGKIPLAREILSRMSS